MSFNHELLSCEEPIVDLNAKLTFKFAQTVFVEHMLGSYLENETEGSFARPESNNSACISTYCVKVSHGNNI